MGRRRGICGAGICGAGICGAAAALKSLLALSGAAAARNTLAARICKAAKTLPTTVAQEKGRGPYQTAAFDGQS